MRKIEYTNRYERDFKKVGKGRYSKILRTDFRDIIFALRNDNALPKKCRDHALTGNWQYHRECHIRPNLLLIYRKDGDDVLALVRLGSHSELFD